MSATWYRVNYSASGIYECEVLHETPATVTVKLRTDWTAIKQSKNGNSDAYFKTWVEAHAALMAECAHRVNGARRLLKVANARHGNAKGLKPPAKAD